MSRPRVTTLLTTFAGLLALTAFLAVLAFPMAGSAWAAGPMRVGGDVKPPEVMYKEPLEYPESARIAKAEGDVILELIIDEKGRVKNPTVWKSSGYPDLDKSAQDAIAQWIFQPATLEGKPVAVYFTITIRFKPEE